MTWIVFPAIFMLCFVFGKVTTDGYPANLFWRFVMCLLMTIVCGLPLFGLLKLFGL